MPFLTCARFTAENAETYEARLAQELRERKLHVERQRPLPVTYKGVRIDCGYRLDMLVERQVILELKAVT